MYLKYVPQPLNIPPSRSQGMDQRVLRRLHGMQAARIEVCSRVLSRCKTLVYGESMLGYAQVRVVGDLDANRLSFKLKFQAQQCHREYDCSW